MNRVTHPFRNPSFGFWFQTFYDNCCTDHDGYSFRCDNFNLFNLSESTRFDFDAIIRNKSLIVDYCEVVCYHSFNEPDEHKWECYLYIDADYRDADAFNLFGGGYAFRCREKIYLNLIFGVGIIKIRIGVTKSDILKHINILTLTVKCLFNPMVDVLFVVHYSHSRSSTLTISRNYSSIAI